jgi:hypothetical protein
LPTVYSPPVSTYVSLATYTVTGSPDAEVIFSSIPATYRDLVCVVDGTFVTDGFAQNFWVRFNESTSSIYSAVRMTGNGSTTASGSETTTRFVFGGANNNQKFNMVLQAFDYSATDKHKVFLGRQDAAAFQTGAYAVRFASTDALTSISFLTADAATVKYAVGTTFSLYGIAA